MELYTKTVDELRDLHRQVKNELYRRKRSVSGDRLPNAIKTHCSKGHEYSGDNLYFNSRNQRQCRTCDAHRAKVYRIKNADRLKHGNLERTRKYHLKLKNSLPHGLV